jgi:hypothetical protein
MIPMKHYRLIGRPAGAFVAALAVALLGFVSIADADDDVADGATPFMSHRFEIEPHLVLGTAPPGFGQGSGIGAGVRASVAILPDGILPKVNDSLAIGFGLDYGRYYGKWALNGYRDRCLHYQTGPDGTQICTDITLNGGDYPYLYIPIVLQWNFWFTRHFAMFAEPGVNLYYLADHGFGAVPAFYLGARWQLSDHTALTVRLGYPTVALGVSFLP